jgi:hypothetical protein
LAQPAGTTAALLTSDLEELDRIVPRGGPGSAMLQAIAQVWQGDDKVGLRTKIYDLAIARDPTFVETRITRSRELLAAAARGVEPCEGESKEQCLAKVRAEADAVAKLNPASCEPILQKARASETESKLDEAQTVLMNECGACSDKISCASERVRIAEQMKSAEPLAAAVRAYVVAACVEEQGCARAHSFLGDVFTKRSEWSRAAEHYQLAASQSRKPEWWLRAADASIKAGELARASWALQKAHRDGAGDPALEQRIQQVQADIFRHDVDHPN